MFGKSNSNTKCPPKIGLVGKMRSGKDLVANYLVYHYGYKRFAFGDELKRYYHELFGYTDGKDREGYQWFGQTMRQRKDDIWIEKCFNKIEDYFYNSCLGNCIVFKPVITDVRQKNEVDKCRNEGFVLIKLEADEETRIKRIRENGDKFEIEQLNHDTEKYVDEIKVDYVINNGKDVTIKELHKQVDDIMSKLFNFK